MRVCAVQPSGEWCSLHKFQILQRVQGSAPGSRDSSQEYYHAISVFQADPNGSSAWLMRLAQCQCLAEGPLVLPPRSWLGWPHLVKRSPFRSGRELGCGTWWKGWDHLQALWSELLERRAPQLLLLSRYLILNYCKIMSFGWHWAEVKVFNKIDMRWKHFMRSLPNHWIRYK